jgi:hypothetical protein
MWNIRDERKLAGQTETLGENPQQSHFFQPQNSHDLTSDRTSDHIVESRQITA